MKRYLYIMLMAALTASCTGLENPGFDKDGKKLFALDQLSFDISVNGPETNAETKAAKSGWTNGDKINLWFATNYAQATPDMVLLYNGAGWNKSYVRPGSTMPQEGTFAAVYESGNSLDSKSATVSGTSSTYTLPSSKVTGGTFNCSPMLMSVSNLSYTIDSKTEVLTAKISGWKYATRFKVLIKTDAALSKSADNYALCVSKECHPVSSFGPAKDADADKTVVNIAYNTKVRYAGGVQEADGIAFYFDGITCNNERITFGLAENGVKTKAYTTATAKTLNASSDTKCTGVSLAYSSFSNVNDFGTGSPESYGDDIETQGPYDIVYHLNDKEDSVTLALANNLAERIWDAKRQVPRIIDSDNSSVEKKEIIIGRTSRSQSQAYYNTTPRPSDFTWKINCTGGNIVITAGGSWALKYAVEKFTNDYLASGFTYTEGKVETGTVEGMQLFPITSGCNLRILDCNVWERDDDTNADAWVSTGESCAISERITRFKQVVRAYMPDVLTFQEYSNTFNTKLKAAIGDYGYSFTNRYSSDFTSIIYNKNTLTYKTRKRVEYDDFTATSGTKIETNGRKSYTINVFEHKATGKTFIVVSTHLWATRNTDGDECRLDEATKLKDGIAEYIADHNYPVFLAGDMNCKISEDPMKLLTNAGYQNVITTATLSRDGSMGWHQCDKNAFKREYEMSSSWWMGNKYDRNDQGRNCVDQFFLYNNNANVEVKVFERIHAWFTILATDHYPNYADFKL